MLIRGRVCECVTLVHYNDCLCYFRWDYIVNIIVSTYIEDLLSNHRNKTSLRDWVRWQEHSRWGSRSVYKIWTRCLISSHWRCWRPTPPTILSLSPSRTSWISVRQPLKRNLSISWGKSFLSDCQTSWRRLTCFQPTSWKCLPLWHCRYRYQIQSPCPDILITLLFRSGILKVSRSLSNTSPTRTRKGVRWMMRRWPSSVRP